MSLVDDYELYFLKYTAIYGEKVAVFYQVGKFHEIYGLDNDKEKMGNVVEVAQLLNIKETRENSAILENNRKNALQAGFNSVSLDRNVDLLVNYGYTVVVVNQVPNTNPVKRMVDYIASPSTNTNGRRSEDPHLVAIYVDQLWNKGCNNYLHYIGMVAMDTSTGTTWFYETNSKQNDQALASDDLTRFIQTFSPVEVIVAYSKDVPRKYITDMISSWGFNVAGMPILNLKPIVYLKQDELPTTIDYAENYLSTIFKDRGHLNILDYLNMTRYINARQAYLYLLTFCEVHNRLLLLSLPTPKMWENNNSLILDNSSIVQLGIFESYYEKQETVLSMLSNNLCTAMGKRLLRERLLNPITDVTELSRRYNAIEAMQKHVSGMLKGETVMFYEIVRKGLKGIRDFDRLHRKIALGTLGPSEFHTLNNNYLQILAIGKILESTIEEELRTFIDKYTKELNIENLGTCTVLETLETNLFRRGNADIDAISDKLSEIELSLNKICTKFSGSKYHEDEGGSYLSLTKAQFIRLKKSFSDDTNLKWSDLYLDEKNKSNVKIRFDALSELFNNKQTYLMELRTTCIKKYKGFLKSIDINLLQRFTSVVAEVDLSAGMAFLSTTRSYCKPILEAPMHAEDPSFVNVIALRHPLVERHTRYVAHDLSLDGGAASSPAPPCSVNSQH